MEEGWREEGMDGGMDGGREGATGQSTERGKKTKGGRGQWTSERNSLVCDILDPLGKSIACNFGVKDWALHPKHVLDIL